MFLRVVFSLLLITVLSSEGIALPPNIYNYIDWTCGIGLSAIEGTKEADNNITRTSSGFFSDSFFKVTCSAPIKRFPVFTPVCFNEIRSRLPKNNGSTGIKPLYTNHIYNEGLFLYISDNSPPFSDNSHC